MSSLANVDNSAWWMVLQWSIAYLVSGCYAGSLEHAADRAALTGAGGLLQMVFYTWFSGVFRFTARMPAPVHG
ncbi:hypothetical protein [Erwinia sp. E_sp_B01_9]|uniref:hypothetical protein n=1 Tax=Erwinia sp. E_sp_B01_9 TaxID=3039403 RepID=UPI003D9B8837